MFSIYAQEGRRFSGTLEQLRRVEKSSRSRAATPGACYGVPDKHDGSAGAVERSLVSDAALSQYRKMLAEQGQPEPVFQAYQVMSQPVVTLRSDCQLAEVQQQVQAHSYQLFPIVNDYQQLRGVLSRNDFYEFILAPGMTALAPSTSLARTFLRGEASAYAVDPVTDVRRVALLLVDQNLQALPVVRDSGQVIGIVSRTDILRCIAANPPLSLWC